jgi:type I restriction enzyme S subunit
MNAEQLLAYFERISDAPDAITRLRQFVLDLAVRGKLVEQNPDDEPASELLKRIEREKDRLVEEGLIKKRDSRRYLSNEEVRFGIPPNWTWTRLGEVGDWGSGSTPPRGNHEFFGGNITWLKSGELNDNEALTGSEEKVTDAAIAKCSFRKNKPGDVLFAMYGATIGKVAILAEAAVTNQAVVGCTPFSGVLNKYLFKFLISQRAQFHLASEGGAQPNVSKEKMVRCPFPLPPLAEQHRIVAKVDELMGLCDRLEAAQQEREVCRTRLTAASLARLNQPADAPQFREHVRFHLQHFPRFTTRPDQIPQLRQTILNLAVRGKLVDQCMSDEPASSLVKKIWSHPDCTIKERVRDFGASNAGELPKGWCTVRLEEITRISAGSTPSRDNPKFWKDGTIPWVSSGATAASVITEASEYITQAGMHAHRLQLYPEGTLLVALYGQGKTRGQVATLGIAATVNQACAAVCAYSGFEEVLPYLKLVMLENYERIRADSAGGPQPNLNGRKIKQMQISLPPLAEQRRIVTKVQELMALCDQLETQLTTIQTQSRRLLEATLYQALAPALETTV